jgi:hypothetical protein
VLVTDQQNRACPNGHMVEPTGTFCDQCGAQLGRRPAHASNYEEIEVDQASNETLGNEALWRQTPDGRWQYRASDYNWYFGDPNSPPPSTDAPPAHVRASGASTAQLGDLPGGAWLTIIGGAMMAVGALLPWWTLTTGIVTVNRNGLQLGANDGFSIDGAIAIGLGVVAVLIGVTRLNRSAMPRLFQRSPIVVGIAGGLEMWSSIDGTRATHVPALVTSSVGYGAWVVCIGAGIVLIGGLVLRYPSG